MRKRSNSDGGQQKSTTVRASSQARAYTQSQLESLRKQLGTAELARRLDIPAPSLRRLLSKGRSGGVPKTLLSLDAVQQRVKEARRKPEITNRERAARAALRAAMRGTLHLEYMAIAERYQMSPKEVYTLGMSPDQLGVAA